MAGKMVDFQTGGDTENGGTAHGYLATPDNPNGRALIVIQEWWGLLPEIEGVADRYAEAGYFALAPDLYYGDKTEHPSEAEQKLMALNVEQAEKDLRGAVDYVSEISGAQQVGSTGYCMGGALSIFAATLNPKVVATSSFYYVFPHKKPDFSQLNGPVLMHFGTNDDFIPVADAEALVQEVKDAGGDVTPHFYEGAGHAFCNAADRLGTYDEELAELAWSRNLEFFEQQLG